MNQNQPTWVGKSLNGRYKINSLLGRGGMSSVYKGTDPNLKRAVAVKLIHPHLSEQTQFIARFEQEAASVAQLRHPNIIQVFDFSNDGDTYYMVLEYIPGETLDQRLTKLNEAGKHFSSDEVVRILATLCDAVAYAHARGMIHRDLKPSNVMITPQNQIILMDFGIAKIVGGAVHTATGASVGTAAYSAPEQITGSSIDHRADIYSLGVILYELASGSRPYEGSSPISMMMKHLNDPIPNVQLVNEAVPIGLATILEKAMAKNPEHRYQSAAEMAVALRNFKTQIRPQPVVPIDPTPDITPQILDIAQPTPDVVQPTLAPDIVKSSKEITSSPDKAETLIKPEELIKTEILTQPEKTIEPEKIDNVDALVDSDKLTDPDEFADSNKSDEKTAVIPPVLPKSSNHTRKWAAGVVVALLLIAAGIAFFPQDDGNGEPPVTEVADVPPTAEDVEVIVVEEEATAVPTEAVEETAVPPTETIAPTDIPPTETAVPPTETPIPIPEGMVLIPEGNFLMGSIDGQADEQPEHEVTLGAYYIDQYEVSSSQYSECVSAGSCQAPGVGSASGEHPVVGINWNQAVAYCEFADKRLPTEAEWEYAASGPDNFTWPWGNTFDATLSAASTPAVQPVTSFPDGGSVFGVFNMSGNVVEWVQDVYSTQFYANSPAENPVNLDDGTQHIYRGGSFGNTNGAFATTSRRYAQAATYFDVDVGFRCAADLP